MSSENNFYLAEHSSECYLSILCSHLLKNVSSRDFDFSLEITRDSLIAAAAILKNHTLTRLDFLVDLISTDKPGEKFRFSIFYSFLSLHLNYRIFVLTQTKEGNPLESFIDLYESASWLERECWDMHGVYFVGHNNFLRLLTDYGFRGHPLRKDFPLSGFVEVFFDECGPHVVYAPVELAQEYRVFRFSSPWSKTESLESEAAAQ